jgi:hypothetical protein
MQAPPRIQTPFTLLTMTKYGWLPIWNGKSCRIHCLPFWPIVLGDAPIRQAIVGEYRSITPGIGPRKMIHGKDVELATGIPDDGSQPLNGRRTRWIYSLLWQAGCIQAEKTLESTSQAPLLFCLSLRLTTEIPLPILNVPIFVLARIRPSVCGKSMVVVSAQQAKLPGEILEHFWSS